MAFGPAQGLIAVGVAGGSIAAGTTFANIAATEVFYGGTGGTAEGEAAFAYNDSTNTLSVDILSLGGGTALLVNDGTAIAALKNSTTAQTFRVYGTTTGSKYLNLTHNGTDALIHSTSGDLQLQNGGSGDIRLYGGGSQSAQITGSVIAVTNRDLIFSNNNNIGQSGGSRPTAIYVLGATGIKQALGASTGDGGLVSIANVNTTAVGNVDAGEDDLITYALPANALSANGKGVRIQAWGTAANNANAKTLKLYFGSQIIETFTLTVSQVDTWSIEAVVYRTGSSTQDWKSRLIQAGTASAVDVEIGTATQTDTAAITIKCTGEGVATNDIVQEGMQVEFIN